MRTRSTPRLAPASASRPAPASKPAPAHKSAERGIKAAMRSAASSASSSFPAAAKAAAAAKAKTSTRSSARFAFAAPLESAPSSTSTSVPSASATALGKRKRAEAASSSTQTPATRASDRRATRSASASRASTPAPVPAQPTRSSARRAALGEVQGSGASRSAPSGSGKRSSSPEKTSKSGKTTSSSSAAQMSTPSPSKRRRTASSPSPRASRRTAADADADADADDEDDAAMPSHSQASTATAVASPARSASSRTTSSSGTTTAAGTPPAASRKSPRTAKNIAQQVRANVRALRHPTHLTRGRRGGAAAELELDGDGDSDCGSSDESFSLGTLSPHQLSSLGPHARARALLHVGSTPATLPCREREFADLLEKVENALDERAGQCVYVAGVPGTGKTATCRQVVRALTAKRCAAAAAAAGANGEAKAQAQPDFDFVEINGMKISEASQVYSILWDAISTGSSAGTTGVRAASSSATTSGSTAATVSSKTALEKLRQHFERHAEAPPSSSARDGRRMTVLLLDEMDQLITARQDVIYNLFNWPNMAHSRLLVLALANTMDLPQRALSAKVASRLGWQSVQFRPYDDRQLTQIVQARLGIDAPGASAGAASAPLPAALRAATAGCERVFGANAITLMAKKVAVVNGDARRMLDVARRALEKVQLEAAELGLAEPPAVEIRHVNAVFADMVKSGKTMHITAIALHAKVLLWSAVACMRKTGLQEVTLEDLHAHHVALCTNHRFGIVSHPSASASAAAAAAASAGTSAVPASAAIPPISLEALARGPLATLCALGLLIAVGADYGSAHAGMHARFLLGVREDEVRFAFREDADEHFRSLA